MRALSALPYTMATASVTLTPSSEGKVAAAAIKVANAAPEKAAEVLYRRDELVQRTNELGALLASAYEVQILK